MQSSINLVNNIGYSNVGIHTNTISTNTIARGIDHSYRISDGSQFASSINARKSLNIPAQASYLGDINSSHITPEKIESRANALGYTNINADSISSGTSFSDSNSLNTILSLTQVWALQTTTPTANQNINDILLFNLNKNLK